MAVVLQYFLINALLYIHNKATPGVDYDTIIAPIMANPGDNQACFNIVIDDDILVEENQECLMASFTAESLVNLEIGTSSSICCIVDDDSKSI